MAAIHQTIAIVDKSNKVVSTSKQLKNVFKEAKLAYLERKAEIVADRKAREERELRKAIKAVSIAEEDARSDTSRRSRRHRSHRHDSDDPRKPSGHEGHHHHRHRYSSESRRRSHSHEDSRSVASSSPSEHPPAYNGLAQFNEELYGTHRSAPTSPDVPRGHGLVRRTTDLPLERYHSHRPAPVRAHSTSDMDGHIDMDLAYGDFHPDSLQLSPKIEQQLQKQEMSSLVEKCKLLMDEANCAQHSVRAIVAHLQKNPDAMAAVALTLAEISNLATKMAPAALASFKTAAPAVFAVLAAPEFLIAVGVGVGLTVVMFGGYKIIKKIKPGDKEEEVVDEMLDVNELSRIEHWRRGISDASDTASVATSVEGEFITPMAAASMGHLPLPRERDEARHKERKRKEKKKHKHRGEDDDADRTVVGSETSTRSKTSSRSEKREKALVKVKKPSPLRRMFTSKNSDSSSRN